MTNPISAVSPVPRGVILGLTLAQSLMLLLIKQAQVPESLLFYTLTLALPAMTALLIRHAMDRFAWLCALTTGLILTPLALHSRGTCAESYGSCSELFSNYGLTLFVALFVLTAYLQNWRDGRRLNYSGLFHHAWDNFLTLGVTAVFTGAGWLVLWLGAALFKVIGIEVLQELLKQSEFSYPATGLMVGLGVVAGRAQPGAIRSALGVCFALCRLLMPLLAVLAIAFAAALPFTGVAALWGTGHGAALLLTLTLALVSLSNAMVQDVTQDAVLTRQWRWLMGTALCLLPVFAGLAALALSLRVNQYGWTVDRLWAAIVTGFSFWYAGGYALAVVRRQTPWLASIAPVNIIAGLALVVILLATQSPLLNLRTLAVASQLNRIEANLVALESLDLDYLRWDLGQDGIAALRQLQQDPRVKANDKLSALITQKLAQKNRWDERMPAAGQPPLAKNFVILPLGAEVPPALLTVLDQQPEHRRGGETPVTQCLRGAPHCLLYQANLGGDERPEWVLLDPQSWGDGVWPVFAQEGVAWKRVGVLKGPTNPPPQTIQDLQQQKVQAVDGVWRDIAIGAQRYRVVED